MKFESSYYNYHIAAFPWAITGYTFYMKVCLYICYHRCVSAPISSSSTGGSLHRPCLRFDRLLLFLLKLLIVHSPRISWDSVIAFASFLSRTRLAGFSPDSIIEGS